MTQASTAKPEIHSAGELNPNATSVERRSSSQKTVWYLGGNHAAKLLTSVDGDLDPDVLAKLASVPAVVGELALSVESLVSDDFTVGGFENDLLAKIAANTLNAKKQAAAATAAVAPKHEDAKKNIPATSSSTPTTSQTYSPPSPSQLGNQSELPSAVNDSSSSLVTFTGSVPNPLLENYDPVPNPLARITPPGSPTPATETNFSSNKRKESPSEETNQHPPKAVRR